MADLSFLPSVWLVAVVLLWCLYLVLQGFDFGVGMLLARVRRDHHDRRVALHAIGPTWAANEVWVVIAVVAMFGAFPGWYAAWASGLYLPLVVVLLALIARNAGIELIGKRDDERWRRGWERVVIGASALAPFCWGLMWSAVVHGLDVRDGDVVGSPLDVLTPYAVLGGLALTALCRALGAAFLALRTADDVRAAAERELRVAAPVAALLAGALLAWTAAAHAPGAGGWATMAACGLALAVLAVAAVAAGPVGTVGGARAAGVAFAAGAAAIGLLVATWFAVLAPEGVADAGGGTGVVLADVVASDYALTLMTVLTGLLLPLLLGLQAWSYWLFRARLTRADVGAELPTPVELVGRLAQQVTGTDRPSGPDAAGLLTGGPGFRRRRPADRDEPARDG